MAGKTEVKKLEVDNVSLDDLLSEETTAQTAEAAEVPTEQETENAFPEVKVAPKTRAKKETAAVQTAAKEAVSTTAQTLTCVLVKPEAIEQLNSNLVALTNAIIQLANSNNNCKFDNIKVEVKELKASEKTEPKMEKLTPYDASVQKAKEREEAKAAKAAVAKPAEKKEPEKKPEPAISYEMLVVQLDRILKGSTPEGEIEPVEFGKQKLSELLKAHGVKSFKELKPETFKAVHTALVNIK